MQAEIITIGDEILIGQIVDTNSAWIAQQLHPVGIEIKQITSVSDDAEHIVKALNEARSRADIILITGGLGPTRDDITKSTLASYFNSELALDPIAHEHVSQIFAKRNLPLLDINEQQALLPVKCTPLYNPIGTAPGMLFEDREQVFVSMPGVPYEMKKMVSEQLIPYLEKKFDFPKILHRTFLTSGIGESYLSKKIESIEDGLPSHIKLAYLPNFSTVRLRFSAKGDSIDKLNAELDEIRNDLFRLIPEYIASEGDFKIQEVIGQLLKEKGETVACAESCTGGMLSHLITSVAGSSAYFMGAVISYDNSVKMNSLGVKENTLDEFGAVSRETVIQMAEGVKQKLNTTYSIASSGIAGPGGGSDKKPVGTVWLAVSGPNGTIAKDYLLYGERLQIIERSAMLGLEMLRKLLTNTDI